MRLRKAPLLLIPMLLASACGTQPPSQPALTPGIHRQGSAVTHALPLANALPAMNISAAAFPTAQVGFLSGTYSAAKGPTTGFVEATTDGGKTWRLQSQTPVEAFASMTFASAARGYAIGGLIPPPQAPGLGPNGAPARTVLFQSIDGAKTWTKAGAVQGTITSLALAPDGTPLIGVSGPCTKGACAGAVMSLQGSALVTLWNAPGPVLAIAFQGANAWSEVAVPASGAITAKIYASTDAGTTWTAQGSLPISTAAMNLTTANQLEGHLSFTSASEGVASLFSLDTCSMGGCGLTAVYRTTDGGSAWVPIQSVQISCQFGPYVSSQGSQVAVVQGVNLAACAGPGTTLFLSSDGGTTFRSLKNWPTGAVPAVGFIPGGGMWAVSAAALMLSNAGGATWTQAFPAVSPTGPVAFTGREVAYAAGDQSDPATFLRSTDGGRTWRVLSSLGNLQAASIAFSGPKVGWIGAVPFPSQPAASARILKTSDGGRTWSAAYHPPANASIDPLLRFFTPERGMFLNLGASCAGNCPIFGAATANGGRTWETLAQGSAPSYIVSAAILSPSDFIALTLGSPTTSGAIYRTADAGRTWTKLLTVPSSINGNGDMSFPTSQTGYMVVNDVKKPSSAGQAQKAVLAIMKTTDGGRAWVLRDLPAIPQSWVANVSFLNAQDGLLSSVGTVWKTTDGGAVWTELP